MKYFDRTSNPNRIDDEVFSFVRGLLHNKQLFDEDGTDAPYVTNALKYSKKDQDRRQTGPYEGDDPFVESIIDVFGFNPLDFQVNSWQTVAELEERRQQDDEAQAAIFSAPTGFGKTEAFLGPVYELLEQDAHESTIIVYPRRALLQNQLERILEHLHQLRGPDSISDLSVGVYVGNMPYELADVKTDYSFFDDSSGRPRFRLASCWCGADAQTHPFRYHGSSREYILKCQNNPEEHTFTNRELMLSRRQMLNDQPDIILTTLESLELFALKPNYNLIEAADSIILDEVHLYTGLRGAHTANIIDNINAITDHPILWMGASATVNNPTAFAQKLFGLQGGQIETERPPASDYQAAHDDHEHYYFMMSPEDGPGASSMMIQQLMLVGHSLLQPIGGARGKALTFIDSISQVNQKHAQLLNADHDRELWRYHLEQPSEANWQTVADEMGYEFLDEQLSFLPVYSDAGFDADAAASSDILLSTSFLEVGIDVGDISVIGQYRTPQSLSSFIQRTGRAAREEDTDAHILVFLTNLTGDTNMFYRAERFLEDDLRTPLKPDNRVVEWIHEQLKTYYEIAVDVYDDRYRSLRQAELDFFERLIQENMEFTEFHEFLTDPGSYLNDRLGIGGDLNDPLIGRDPVMAVDYILDDKQEEIDDELSEINEYIDIEGEAIVRSEDAFQRYLREIRTDVLELIQTYHTRLERARTLLNEAGDDSQKAIIETLQDDLASAREDAVEYRSLSKEQRVLNYENLLIDLTSVAGQLNAVIMQADRKASGGEGLESVRLEAIDELQDAVALLDGLAGDERLEYLSQQRKQVYYLNKVIDEIRSYRSIEDDDDDAYDRPFYSLFYTKHLLRAAYYFERMLNVTDESMGEVWYVPPSYFESSGQYLTVFHGEHDRSGSEESLHSLVSSYAPYSSEYQDEPGTIQLFMPETRVVESGDEDEQSTVEFDFSDVPGERQDGLIIPDSITTTTVPDLTGDAARSIVQYCPQCLQILDRDGACLDHNDRAFGKVYGSPLVETRVTPRNTDDSTGGLALCDLTAEVRLEGVSLTITPAEYMGSEVGYVWADQDRIEREIQSPARSLGFSLDTRGLVYDIKEWVDSLGGDISNRVATYKDLNEVDFEYIAYHTAAHYLLQIVSDISGVSPSILFYGIDQQRGEIFVFERTEGGQGLVDLVYEEIETDPGAVLETINRFGYNPQVINERLWASDAVVSQLSSSPLTEDQAQAIVKEHTDIPYQAVLEKVTQEFVSAAERATQLSRSEDVSLSEAYRLKHEIAAEQVAGAEEFPIDIVHERGFEDEETIEAIESLFYSPDIDGCIENLHLSECISGHSQEEALSYVLLEEFREYLTHSTSDGETRDRMFETEQLPASIIDDTHVFLTF